MPSEVNGPFGNWFVTQIVHGTCFRKAEKFESFKKTELWCWVFNSNLQCLSFQQKIQLKDAILSVHPCGDIGHFGHSVSSSHWHKLRHWTWNCPSFQETRRRGRCIGEKLRSARWMEQCQSKVSQGAVYDRQWISRSTRDTSQLHQLTDPSNESSANGDAHSWWWISTKWRWPVRLQLSL